MSTQQLLSLCMASKTTLVFVNLLLYLTCSMSIREQDLSNHLIIENGSKLGFTGGPQAIKSAENPSSGGSSKEELYIYTHDAGYRTKGLHGTTPWHGVRAEITVWEIPDVQHLSSSGAYIAAINESPGLELVTAGWHLKQWKKGQYYANGLKIVQVITSYMSWTQLLMAMETNMKDKTNELRDSIGFVEANGSNLYPGEAFHPPLSAYNGEQRGITIRIKKDERTGDWSLYREDLGGPIGGMTLLGWWPGTLFTYLSENADVIQWAGFVTHNYNKTSPSMGSGHFSSELDGKAASFNDCFGFDQKGRIVNDYFNLSIYEDKPDCYDVSPWYHAKHVAKRHFFYGGPGGCSEYK